jgi:hypothetical protein
MKGAKFKMQQATLEKRCKEETSDFCRSVKPHIIEEKEKYDPLKTSQEYDLGYSIESSLKERRSIVMARCPCPCPKISAPIFAAGYVVFSPI